MVRDPGGAWGAPLTVALAPETSATVSLSADVSDRGDVIVAVKAFDLDVQRPDAAAVALLRRSSCAGRHVRRRRAASAPGRWRSATSVRASPPRARRSSSRRSRPGTVNRRSRSPWRRAWRRRAGRSAHRFTSPTPACWSSPALAVAADGRALIAAASGTSMVVAERAPGAGFGAATPVGSAGEGALVPRRSGALPMARPRSRGRGCCPATSRSSPVRRPGAFSPPVRRLPHHRVVPRRLRPVLRLRELLRVDQPVRSLPLRRLRNR